MFEQPHLDAKSGTRAITLSLPTLGFGNFQFFFLRFFQYKFSDHFGNTHKKRHILKTTMVLALISVRKTRNLVITSRTLNYRGGNFFVF